MTDSQKPDREYLMAIAAQQDFEQSNGCCAFELAGVELIADPAGIAYWPDERCLIVSDLHLEKGSSFARRGQLLPPYDTDATLAKLQKCIDRWQPKTIISLGDSFHDASASLRLPIACRRQLAAMTVSCDWVWIAGNHDPEPPVDLAGQVAEQLTIGPFHFCHEPRENAAKGEIAGHLHPKAKIRVRGRTIVKRCFAVSKARLIMPSFGAFTGGLNVLDATYAGLLDRPEFHALLMGEQQVYRIAGQDLRR